MKKLIKFFVCVVFALCLSVQGALAVNCSSISKVLHNTDLNPSSVVSYTVINNKTGQIVCSKDPNLYLNPASSIKLLTMASVSDAIGPFYRFETVFYIDKEKNVYLKLGADPLFSSNDLNALIKSLRKAYSGRIKNFYIDDTVISKTYYPDGWTVDDFWPSSPQITSYIIDSNLVKVDFQIHSDTPKSRGGVSQEPVKSVRIIQNDPYKFSFINSLEIGAQTKIEPSLNYGSDSGIVTLNGTISADVSKTFPVLDPVQFFTGRLRKALDVNGINYSKPFYSKKVPKDAKRIASFSRPIKDGMSFVLKTSNNLAAETIFDLGTSVWAQQKDEYIKNAYGADVSSEKSQKTADKRRALIDEYAKSIGLDLKKANFADASGVSRYNTITTSILANALYLGQKSAIKEFMASPDEGTLKGRMKDLAGNLKAKTGTIFGVSAIAGYITALDGTPYSFSVIIQNFSTRSSLIKGLEDDIIHGIYYLK